MNIAGNAILMLLVFAIGAGAQEAVMPSQREINDLLKKADEKVSDFEVSIRIAKPKLDKLKPEAVTNYLESAFVAHTLIRKTSTNGTTSYRLLGIITSLDDLSMFATEAAFSITAVALVSGEHAVPEEAMMLLSSKTSCHDISELIFHAAFRYMDVQEELMKKLMEKQ